MDINPWFRQDCKKSFEIKEYDNCHYLEYTGEIKTEGKEYSSKVETTTHLFSRMILTRLAAQWMEVLLLYPILNRYCGDNNGILLELGCSDAELRDYIYRNGFNLTYVGLEARTKVLDEALKKRHARESFLIKYDLNFDWIFAPSSFNFIVSYFVIEHLERVSQVKLMKNVHLSLEDDGFFFVGTNFRRLSGELGYPDFHLYEFLQSEFEEMLKGIGFEIVDFFILDSYDSNARKCLPYSQRVLLNRFLKRGFHSSAMRILFNTMTSSNPRNILYVLSKKRKDRIDNSEAIKIACQRFKSLSEVCLLIRLIEREIDEVNELPGWFRFTLKDGTFFYIFKTSSMESKISLRNENIRNPGDFKILKKIGKSNCLIELRNSTDVKNLVTQILWEGE